MDKFDKFLYKIRFFIVGFSSAEAIKAIIKYSKGDYSFYNAVWIGAFSICSIGLLFMYFKWLSDNKEDEQNS